MKKLFAMLVAFVFIFSVAVSAASVDVKATLSDKQVKKMAIIEKLQAKGNLKIDWNNEKDSPRFISGNLSDKPVTTADAVVQYMETNKALFNLDNGKFQVKKVEKDTLGMTHYKTQYTIGGMPVFGSEMIVHTDKAGNVTIINGMVDTNVPAKDYSKMVKINAQAAIKAAESTLGFTPDAQTYTVNPKAETMIYNANKEWQPVYEVSLSFLYPYPANMKVYVNAETGKVVDSYNALTTTATTATGTGVLGQTRTLNVDLVSGTYYLRDLTTRSAQILTYTCNNGTTLSTNYVTDTDGVFNSTTQKAGVDAHYYATAVFDYYKNNFNRNSYNNAGAAIKSNVHYSTSYNNAFWDGTQMVYGDGDGTSYRAFSCAADVVAHEISHAVTEYTCNLTYSNQSGALNESISDVFGYLIEGDAADWLMGEDCVVSGDPFRSFSNPTLYGQPDNMSGYVNTTSDNGGVHTNSGIPNHAFYHAAIQMNDNAKLGQIWYRASTTYLTASSDFMAARNAYVQSATDLYGAATAQIISDAFASVGLGGTTVTDNYEPNNSTTAAYAITSGTTYNALIASSTDVDYYKFTTNATGTISVTLQNLPGDYDLYLLNSAGTQVAKSENANTTNESISYSATTTGTFYVKVVGYNGVYSTSQQYALKATYPTSGGGTSQWYYETKTYDSPHNYTNSYNGTNTYTKVGATQVTVHFSRFETEAGYDYVYIKDKNGNTINSYNGTLSAFWATVSGDTLNMNLVTDSSVTAYGYHVDQVGYYANGQLIIENLDNGTVTVGPAPDQTAPINLGGPVIQK